MLCPKVEKSGALVQMDGLVEGYPLGVKVSWTPAQEGSGEPYPAGGGKNLWGNLMNNIFIGQGGVQEGNKTAKSTGKIPCAEKDVYTLSSSAVFSPAPGNVGVVAYFDSNDKMLSRTAATGNYAVSLTAPVETAYVRASCYAPTNDDKIQFEKGATQTAYAPYENIRPIQGRTEVKVERCGENLLNIKPFDTNTGKGITFEYVPEGGIHIQGTASASADSPTFPVWHLPPGKYYGLDMGAGIAASIVVLRNGRNLWLNTKGIFEILAGDVTKYWYVIVANGVTLNNTIYPYIVPGTTAPTTYTPYIGRTNTLTLPETVYGGEVDAEGKGQETWGYMDSYAGETLPAEWICDRAAYAVGTTPPNGAQVAYKLDKPKPFTATGGTVIPALSGTNTVLTDADSVTAAGRADPIQTIAKLSNRIAALEAAATNITE